MQLRNNFFDATLFSDVKYCVASHMLISFFFNKKDAVLNSNEGGIMKRQLCRPCSVDNSKAS